MRRLYFFFFWNVLFLAKCNVLCVTTEAEKTQRVTQIYRILCCFWRYNVILNIYKKDSTFFFVFFVVFFLCCHRFLLTSIQYITTIKVIKDNTKYIKKNKISNDNREMSVSSIAQPFCYFLFVCFVFLLIGLFVFCIFIYVWCVCFAFFTFEFATLSHTKCKANEKKKTIKSTQHNTKYIKNKIK